MAALSTVHPGKRYPGKLGNRYTHPLSATFSGYKSAKPDKVAIARKLTKTTSALDDQRGTGLRRDVEKLVKEIEVASGVAKS